MPPSLAVTLGPLELKNPVVCASGEWVMTAEALRAAIDAGAAAVVAKSTNESAAAKGQLAAAEYVLLDEEWRPVERATRSSSLLNRSGLVDVPFDEWVETLAAADAYARSRDAFVVPSLIVADVDEAAGMARAFEEAGLRWLELNVGAAHGEEAPAGAIRTGTALVAPIRDAVSIPLMVKLPGQGDVVAMAAEAAQAGADAVCLAGRPLAFLPDPDTRRPLLGTFGALGGAWALPLTLRWVAKARRRLGPDVPLLATNGIRDGRDVARALLAGATAVELGTAVWTDGFEALARTIGELERYLAEQGADASELVGEAADAVLTYEDVRVRRAS